MFIVGRPSRSTGTIEEYWLEQITARTSRAGTPAPRNAPPSAAETGVNSVIEDPLALLRIFTYIIYHK